MNYAQIAILGAIALLFGRIPSRNPWRIHILMGVSALAVFAIQPALKIRGLDFWLSTITLGMIIFSWILVSPKGASRQRTNIIALAILVGIVVLVDLTRYLGIENIFTPTIPPRIMLVLVFLFVLALGLSCAVFLKQKPSGITLFILILLILFLALKIPMVVQMVSGWMRSLLGYSAAKATSTDLRWLGFSYIAFRILHTLRDRQLGRLPDVSLAEYVTYVIFFPALTAGPIDRLERFTSDLRQPLPLNKANFTIASRRLVTGLFKKFVIADVLGFVALNSTNALLIRTAGWTWVLLYAYAFQIFFDFSGYTDIAIGLGRFMGIQLPENFSAPYSRANLTQFWNHWHMTLTQWFRVYFFNPVTRALRSRADPLPPAFIILITQISTMLLIGLWHGVTWNYAIWGLWHGLGLFIQNRWSAFARPWAAKLDSHPGLKWLSSTGSVLLTFNFVALGWVWFVIPDLNISWHILLKLFGAS